VAASLFIGIDGGATRSRAVLMDAAGTVLGRQEGGPAIVRAGDPGDAAAMVVRLARALLAEHAGGGAATALCCGLAGAGREAERAAVRGIVADTGVARHTVVTSDAEVALEDAFAGGAGILLIAGTGSVAWARGAAGTVRVGGWGQHLGDDGSGYAVGLAGLRSVAHAADGMAPPTPMHAALLAAAGVSEPPGLIAWISAASKKQVAALAPIVCAHATAGDVVARRIVRRSVNALVAHLAAAWRRSGPWDRVAPVALAGGMVSPGGPLRPLLAQALAGRCGGRLALADHTIDAAAGAAAIARRAAADAGRDCD
jgi:N-acetylglucosamine kinase-like BadF-type ATPase